MRKIIQRLISRTLPRAEREIGKVRDGSVHRRPFLPRTVRRGDELATFLNAASLALQLEGASPDLTADLTTSYGADELQVYECVQDAEEIWGVRLLPPSIPVAQFPQQVGKFTSLGAIVEAAESARGAA